MMVHIFLMKMIASSMKNKMIIKNFLKIMVIRFDFYGREGQLIKKEDLSEFDLDYLDYIYLEDNTLAEITASYIEEYIPSPFEQFGNIAGYFWWDSDDEEWKDFSQEYNNLIKKN